MVFLASVYYLNANAQTYVTIPDTNFTSYLQNIIPGAMSGNQLNTSSTLVTTSTRVFNLSYKSISDLSGIQYFSSLDSLYGSYNFLTTLPILPNSLIYIDISNNQITNLSALPNSLIYIDVSNNQITSLPALPNSLQYFNSDFNYHLNSLPALPNTLQYLYCPYNSLTTLPVLPHQLQYLYCEYNLLTSLPVLPDSLLYLLCDSNRITCFPTFPKSLNIVSIQNNHFTCLPNYIRALQQDTVTYPLCAVGNTNGCAVAGINQIIDVSNQVNIYPNPAQNNFTIETNNTDKQILQITDVNGKQVLTQTINGTTNVDASNLNAGVYNISISSNTGVVNKKLVIVK